MMPAKPNFGLKNVQKQPSKQATTSDFPDNFTWSDVNGVNYLGHVRT